MQTATISKTMIKFWSKFHFQILCYSCVGNNRFLITPSLISPRKILLPVPLGTSARTLVCIFSSILNSEIEGWKYRSRELLKAIFLLPKKTIRKQTFSWNWHELFFICMKSVNTQVRINKMVTDILSITTAVLQN